MSEIRIVKMMALRNKIAVIPGKLILTALALLGLCWNTDPSLLTTESLHSPLAMLNLVFAGRSGGSLELFWSRFQSNPLPYLCLFAALYGIFSYLYLFIRLIGNWVIGVAVAVIVFVLAVTQAGKMSPEAQILTVFVMLFGGPILDLVHILHYAALRQMAKDAEAEEEDRSYGRGYDSGFASGYDRGRRDRLRGDRARRGNERRLHYDSRRSLDWDDSDNYSFDDEYEEDVAYDDCDEEEGYYDAEPEDDYDDEESEEDGYYDAEFGDDCDEDDYDEEDSSDWDGRRSYRRTAKVRQREQYTSQRAYRQEQARRARQEAIRQERERQERARRERAQQREAQNHGNRGAYAGQQFAQQGNGHSFFAGCTDEISIKKRYRDLCKVYHPDGGNGSPEVFAQINEEYQKLIKG